MEDVLQWILTFKKIILMNAAFRKELPIIGIVLMPFVYLAFISLVVVLAVVPVVYSYIKFKEIEKKG
jgi:hypothetical protein